MPLPITGATQYHAPDKDRIMKGLVVSKGWDLIRPLSPSILKMIIKQKNKLNK